MVALTCEYCSRVFPKKQNLTVHQKSKYCLKIQEQQKTTLSEEIKLLKIKEEELYAIIRQKDKLLEEKEEVIKQKDRDILDIAMKNTNITVNNNNNKYNFLQIFQLSPELIKSKIESNFTKDHFLDGQKGIAHFTYENLIKNDDGTLNYYCSDLARKIFIFKNKDGKITKDFKSEFLTNLITKDIIAKSRSIYELGTQDRQHIFNLAEINNMKYDNSSFVTTLAGLSCNIITHENGEITYEIIDDEDDDDYDRENEIESEDILRAKYTVQYFDEREKLIESYPKESSFYRKFRLQFDIDKEKYKRFLV
jgi:hypothetical protein